MKSASLEREDALVVDLEEGMMVDSQVAQTTTVVLVLQMLLWSMVGDGRNAQFQRGRTSLMMA